MTVQLVKYCNEQHNITKSCKTIRLGTFKDFQKIESKKNIADESDGKELVNVESYDSDTASEEATEVLSPWIDRGILREYCSPSTYRSMSLSP